MEHHGLLGSGRQGRAFIDPKVERGSLLAPQSFAALFNDSLTQWKSRSSLETETHEIFVLFLVASCASLFIRLDELFLFLRMPVITINPIARDLVLYYSRASTKERSSLTDICNRVCSARTYVCTLLGERHLSRQVVNANI